MTLVSSVIALLCRDTFSADCSEQINTPLYTCQANRMPSMTHCVMQITQTPIDTLHKLT